MNGWAPKMTEPLKVRVILFHSSPPSGQLIVKVAMSSFAIRARAELAPSRDEEIAMCDVVEGLTNALSLMAHAEQSVEVIANAISVLMAHVPPAVVFFSHMKIFVNYMKFQYNDSYS